MNEISSSKRGVDFEKKKIAYEVYKNGLSVRQISKFFKMTIGQARRAVSEMKMRERNGWLDRRL